MSVEEVFGRLKVHENRLLGYEDKEEEKHFLLTHEKFLAWTKKNDGDVVAITRKIKGVNVVVDMATDLVTEEVVTIP